MQTTMAIFILGKCLPPDASEEAEGKLSRELMT
jgi:hypothetical protein